MKIAIVGGGIGGLVTAFMAVDAGHEVTLFEKDRIGAGASGKALGVLVPVTGLDRPIDRLQRAGIAAWPGFAERLADITGVKVETFWREWPEQRQQVRLPLVFDVLKMAIEALGGVVKEGFEVESPSLLKNDFDKVVLASGLGNAVLCGAAMKVSAGVACRMKGKLDTLIAGDNLFICPDWDGTVVAGSVNWEMDQAGNGHVPPEKLAELLTRIEKLVPELELVESWVGYRPVEVPRLPLVRNLGDGLHAVAGLGKIGIGVSPMIWEHCL
ncbi:MAG: FAD-dependent oxidoreductase [Alphaproteobacteria bacterium]|nr:MAG: FAD-dependent oxidoreductase [Alphaproteobacteria bacterium]